MVLKVEPDLQKIGSAEQRNYITSAHLGSDYSVRPSYAYLNSAAMADLEGNFDVIIFGTGLVESIVAA